MLLDVKIVQKRFGQKVLLQGFSLYADAPGVTAIEAPSGKGKTTLFRLITGLDRDFEGSIRVEGGVSILYQEHRLFPSLSALDNVVLLAFAKPGDVERKRAESLLSRLGLSAEDLSKKPTQLSGGMARRVAFARAVLSRGDVLLLDEPTKELDDEARAAVLSVIADEAKRRIVLLISHRADDAPTLGANKAVLG